MNLVELKTLFKDEICQRKEEGCDVSAFDGADVDAFDLATLEERFGALERLEPSKSYPYVEPSTLEEIRLERPAGPRLLTLSASPQELRDRVLGAWLGRAAGCLLGKPVEGWHRRDIDALLTKVGKRELGEYFSDVQSEDGTSLFPPHVAPWLADRFDAMPCDDDMDYTLLGLLTLEKCGRDFTTDDIARQWLNLLPYARVYTAEQVAYRNYVCGLRPPETALYRNPYREWIGAQIRADMWGYVNPGNPERAAEFAFRDASLSHVKNGIYGAMFVSATLAAVLAGVDLAEAVDIGLTEIPAKSRFAEMARQVREWCVECDAWQPVWERIEKEYGTHNWVHTLNNAAYVLVALLMSENDFDRAITTAVSCGRDTDCNGATAGSIMGAFLGADRLPAQWILPLNDTLHSDLAGIPACSLTDLAYRTFRFAAT